MPIATIGDGRGPSLAWVRRDGRDCLRLSLDPGAWSVVRAADPSRLFELLPVYPAALLDDGTGAGSAVPSLVQPMGGAYRVEGPDGVVFTPMFPFLAGEEYAVLVLIRSGSGRSRAPVLTLRRPARRPTEVTHVVEIAPDLDQIPRNLLRVYIEFSGPMSEGWAERCVSVSDLDTGDRLTDGLLSLDPELWDPERRRLTVLFDPARIKRGLAPHRQAGYPLVEGTRVAVEVDAAFRDAAGLPLGAAGRRAYRVGPDLRGRVDPHSWAVTAPAAGTREALVVEFGRPLDRALLARCVRLEAPDGGAVAGAAAVGAGGRSWSFTPADAWTRGTHRFVVDDILEDVAGNSVRRVFDRDLERTGDEPLAPGPVGVDIAIR